MVQMRPPHFVDTNSVGEKILFDKFESLTGADDWIVLHSLDIFGDVNFGEGEADIVVLVPGRGMLVIEVKSHEHVEFKYGAWHLGGKLDDRGPVKQAKNAGHALRKWLVENKIEVFDVPITFGVWFTCANALKIQGTPEWKDWMLLFASDLNRDLKEVVLELLDSGIDYLESNRLRFPSALAPSTKIKAIGDALRPHIVIQKSAEQRSLELKKMLSMAIEEQNKVLALISGSVDKYLVQGIAGTGKTHIALIEAKRSHQRGQRTLLLCFNSLLASYLKEQTKGFSLVEATTIHAYMMSVANITPPPNADSDWWMKELPDKAIETLLTADGLDKFDSVIIDEGQDLGLKQYLEVIDLSLAGGLNNGKIVVFGDFNHQAMYMAGNESLEAYLSMIPGLLRLGSLSTNCRNTVQIGKFVTTFSKNETTYSGYLRSDKGPNPQIAVVDSNEKLLEPLKNELHRLLKLFNPEDIVVLSSSKTNLESLIQKTNISHTQIGRDTPGKIRWGSTQAFKGLESPVIVLVEFGGTKTFGKEEFYVAATRSTLELTCILHQEPASEVFPSSK